MPWRRCVRAPRPGASSPARDIEWVFSGLMSATSVGFDSVNNVVFRPAGNGDTVASTYLFVDANGTIVDADIVFWDGGIHWFTGMSGCSGGAYIEDVATREFGYALGIDHSTDARDTMYGQHAECSTLPRTLTGKRPYGDRGAVSAGGSGVVQADPNAESTCVRSLKRRVIPRETLRWSDPHTATPSGSRERSRRRSRP